MLDWARHWLRTKPLLVVLSCGLLVGVLLQLTNNRHVQLQLQQQHLLAPELVHGYDVDGKSAPGQLHGLDFGARNAHRLAHLLARKTHGEDDLLPFDANLILPEFRNETRLEVEAEYFRFRDRFGLINTDWTDEQILYALQRLVNIYAQANVRIRIRANEALEYVDLSEARAKAYWYYVDYPRGDALSKQRRERKEWMDRVIGNRLISLLERVEYKDRNGVLDWITGFPLERTAWEHANVVAIYPTYFYYYMNGGGETNCVRFRAGDCTKPKPILSLGDKEKNATTMCYHMEAWAVNSKGWSKAEDVPVVRRWERNEFTVDMAARLIAHEFGHALKLQHVTYKSCVQVPSWKEGNLMHQVRQMTSASEGQCTKVGFPAQAAAATALTADQCRALRANLRSGVRETRVLNAERVGKSIEVLGQSSHKSNFSVFGFVAQQIKFTRPGRVVRVRWKSSGRDLGESIKISVGAMENSVWKEEAFNLVRPHSLGAHVHQEHDVNLRVRPGQFIALLSDNAAQNLRPETRIYENDDQLLLKDLTANVKKRVIVHEYVSKLINSVDRERIEPIPALVHRDVWILTSTRNEQQQGPREWRQVTRTEWILNVDFAPW